MKFFGKALGLVVATLALSSCGGGGGDGGSTTPPVSGKIELVATTTTLPTNVGGYLPSQHGPNQAEVTITIRNADGTLMVGRDVQVSISPVETAALSFLVQDGNDNFDNLWGAFTIKGTNGVTTAWVNSRLVAGTVNLTASTIDPTTQRTISNTLKFTITSGVGQMPTQVALATNSSAVYLPSSGGRNSVQVGATVRDGGDQLVPDPNNADNIQFEIIGVPGGALLSTNSTSGAASGLKVNSHTVHGVATASFQAAENTPQGAIQVRATVDRADNNVSNGIQDAVTSTIGLVVSDGKLYSVTITSPNVDAILENRVDAGADEENPGLNGTYSLIVSALGTDRQGNPVLPGTLIHFGSIDEPVGTFDSGATANEFLLAGGDGNPQEGGTGFTAPNGHFTTAGGGAGPGDALIVFGKTHHGAPHGNEDLESSVTVQSVTGATSLVAASKFNRNDTTGTLVDYGPVLPYIIGRSQHGNITASAPTNELGVASALLTYTVSTLGHRVAMWAQGDGIDRVTGGARRVTDAVKLVYPGVAPATLVAFPSPIPGNQTVPVTVCFMDANNSPIQGVSIGFLMTLGGGTGSVDGNGMSGFLDNTTGADGCVDAVVQSSGVPATAADGTSGQITFSVGGATAEVDIVVQLSFLSAGGEYRRCAAGNVPTVDVAVRAFATDGSAAAGVAIAATCTGGTVTPASATTDANGTAEFSITGPADTTASCTFSAQGVAPLVRSISLPPADSFSPPCQ